MTEVSPGTEGRPPRGLTVLLLCVIGPALAPCALRLQTLEGVTITTECGTWIEKRVHVCKQTHELSIWTVLIQSPHIPYLMAVKMG